MNRIIDYDGPPDPKGAFSDTEALTLLLAYRRDPSSVPCPRCGPERVEILGFIEPEIDDAGYARLTDPKGEYAVAIFCHECERAIGILPSASSNAQD